jgi:hypothetical protein
MPPSLDDEITPDPPAAPPALPAVARTADALARTHVQKAIDTLVNVMDFAEKDADRVKAADIILDRGYGKPLAATIAIPIPKRIASQLYSMSDDELLERINGGNPVHTTASGKFDFDAAIRTLPSIYDTPPTDSLDTDDDPLFE